MQVLQTERWFPFSFHIYLSRILVYDTRTQVTAASEPLSSIFVRFWLAQALNRKELNRPPLALLNSEAARRGRFGSRSEEGAASEIVQ